MGWIGVDLDGTLAKYKSGQGSKIGDPVPQMVSKLKDWHKEKQEVRIFTARAETLHGKNEVINWLKKNNLPSFTVTNIKDSKMIELWDDKAIRVEKIREKLVQDAQAVLGSTILQLTMTRISPTVEP